MLSDALKALVGTVESFVASFKTALLVIVLVALALWVGRCSAARAAVTQERINVLTHTIKVDVPVYIHDTIIATRTRTLYDSARIVDTVSRNDTVYVRRDVADTAINACARALHDCEHIRLLNDSLTKQIAKQRPTFWSKVGISVGPSIVAARDGTVVWGVGATLGYKIW